MSLSEPSLISHRGAARYVCTVLSLNSITLLCFSEHLHQVSPSTTFLVRSGLWRVAGTHTHDMQLTGGCCWTALTNTVAAVPPSWVKAEGLEQLLQAPYSIKVLMYCFLHQSTYKNHSHKVLAIMLWSSNKSLGYQNLLLLLSKVSFFWQKSMQGIEFTIGLFPINFKLID